MRCLGTRASEGLLKEAVQYLGNWRGCEVSHALGAFEALRFRVYGFQGLGVCRGLG